MDAPKLFFKTKIYHPNVDYYGNTHIDILYNKWSPALQIRTVFNQIQALLANINIDNPLNEVFASHFKSDPEGACAQAKEWTKKFA